jgi:hypothetical protein
MLIQKILRNKQMQIYSYKDCLSTSGKRVYIAHDRVKVSPTTKKFHHHLNEKKERENVRWVVFLRYHVYTFSPFFNHHRQAGTFSIYVFKCVL